MKLKSIVLFILFHSYLNGQTLLPFLNENGKISLVDSVGKEYLPPVFDEVNDIVNYDQHYFRAKKNNKDVITLRSGDEFENIGFIDILKIQYFEEDFISTQYEVPHLFLISYKNKLVYFNTKTKRKIEILRKDNSYSSFEEDYHERYSQGKYINAYNGYIRFFEDGKVNFFDMNLNKVFQIGLFDAMSVSKNYFIVKNESGKYGIANNKGVFLTGYDWEVVKWAKRKDEFIVSKSKVENLFSIYSFSDNAIKGQTFYDLKPGSNSYLIYNRNKTVNGIMDFNGNVTYETDTGSISHTKNDKFIISHFGEKHFDVIDFKGEKLIDLKFINHQHSKSYFNGVEYHLFKTDTATLLFNQNLDLKFKGNVDIQEYTKINGKPYFVTSRNELIGLINLDGKTIFEPIYNKIDLLNINNEFKIRYLLNGLYGIKNIDGEDLIINKYSLIENDDHLVACKNIGNSNIWDFYNVNGELSKSEKRNNKNDLIRNYFYDKNEDVLKAIFNETNKQIVLPSNIGVDREIIKILGNELNYIIRKKMDKQYFIFGKDYKNIIPEGFIMNNENHIFDNLDEEVYITVWKNHDKLNDYITNSNDLKPKSNTDYPSKLIAPSAPPPPTNPQTKKKQNIHGTGLINSKGDWILPYKPNAFYFPISKNLIIERVLDDEGYFQDTSRIIILGKNIKSWDITWLGLQYSKIKDPNYVFRAQNIDKRVKALYAYFSIKGEKLSDFIYVAGPSNLSNFNLVGIQNSNEINWQIVDKSCKLIRELPKLSAPPNPEDFNIYKNYFFVKIEDSWVKFDSVGNNLGFITKDKPIKSFKNGWNIFYVDDLKKFELRNLENKVIFTSEKEFDFNISQKSDKVFITYPDGSSDGFIFDKQGNLLKKVKGTYISEKQLKTGFNAIMLKHLNKYFYISTML